MQIFPDALGVVPFFVGVASPELAEMEEVAAAAVGEDAGQLRVVGQVGVEECGQLVEAKPLDIVAACAEAIVEQSRFGRALHGEEKEGADQNLLVNDIGN